MGTEQDLIQKLMISKKIMEKHNEMGRGQGSTGNYNVNVDNFEPAQGNYNIPQEFMAEQQAPTATYSNEIPTKDRILNSRLPDEIKRLMIEHPIDKPANSMAGPTLSNDLVDKAARLMNLNAKGEQISETVRRQPTQQTSPVITEDIKSIIRETIEDVLRENGLITESETPSNDLFKFRVGQHLFEGKLTKIKKIAK
jgi:hypothetical protein